MDLSPFLKVTRDITLVVAAAILSAAPAFGDGKAAAAPWWKQQKIRLMWGQWNYERIDLKADFWRADLPRELFRNVAEAGGTVFVEIEGYKPDHARYAHEFGMKYFATRFVAFLASIEGRNWVSCEREVSRRCPLDQATYEKWILHNKDGPSILEGARQGLVDGIHFDWEGYGGRSEAGVCYCDDCMSKFQGFTQTGEALPDKKKRFAWIEEHGFLPAYEQQYRKRRLEMFTSIREKAHAVKPDLLFSSYDMIISEFSLAMHTRAAPFLISDAHHYLNDQTQPWWRSYGAWLRERGYLYIPGSWANALFGAQASNVSAAQWIYEASINEDGAWVWFERELDDEILRAYAAADRRIQAVVGKVGRYLFHGQIDHTFATAVEWSGRPQLEHAIQQQSYHLDGEHLVQVNNVHTEWPLRVRLRFPRLTGAGPWTVRDALHDLTYTHDIDEVRWTADDLAAGLTVALEPRSDIYLLLSPARAPLQIDRQKLIHSRQFDMLDDHATGADAAGPVKQMMKLYLMKNAIYDDPDDDPTSKTAAARLENLLASAQTLMVLPKDGWHFRMDKSDIGPGKGWFIPQTSLDDWVPIQIETFWGNQGGSGPGWYRRDVQVPALADDKQVYLHFGGVDEELVLWINGKYAGDYNRGLDGWDKPFAIDVTGKLVTGKNHLALRVYNSAAAGGVWKPVRVLVGPKQVDATAEAPDGDTAGADSTAELVYTATESMGLRGSMGGLSIANTIRTVSADQQRQVRLRQLRGHLWSPRYAPGGERIAFVHDASGRGQINVMNRDGSDVRNVSNNSYCDRSPAWSPDGHTIAYICDRGGDWDIYAMDADSSDQRRIAGGPGRDLAPAWSPDGRMLAWESHASGMPAVWVCAADGTDAHPVLRPDIDTRYVTWEHGKPTEEQPFLRTNDVYMTQPVWSPDGTRLAGVGLWKHWMVYSVAVDGSQLDILHTGLQGAANVCWSPDGKRLAGSFATAPQETERSGIFVIDVANGEHKFIVDVEPIGPRLGGAKRFGLHTWYAHGSAQPRRVVKTFTSVAWSPDGASLVFSSDMDPKGAFYLYTIDAEGGEPVRLETTRSAWPQQVMWTP